MPDDFQEGEPDQPRKRRPRDEDDDDEEERRPRRKSRRDSADDGGVSTIIPYRNGMALTAYYLGVFGLVSCIFGPLAMFGVVPLVLGILGLKKAAEDPDARGRAHAWTGIALGTLELLVGCGASGFIGYTIVMKK